MAIAPGQVVGGRLESSAGTGGGAGVEAGTVSGRAPELDLGCFCFPEGGWLQAPETYSWLLPGDSVLGTMWAVNTGTAP